MCMCVNYAVCISVVCFSPPPSPRMCRQGRGNVRAAKDLEASARKQTQQEETIAIRVNSGFPYITADAVCDFMRPVEYTTYVCIQSGTERGQSTAMKIEFHLTLDLFLLTFRVCYSKKYHLKMKWDFRCESREGDMSRITLIAY